MNRIRVLLGTHIFWLSWKLWKKKGNSKTEQSEVIVTMVIAQTATSGGYSAEWKIGSKSRCLKLERVAFAFQTEDFTLTSINTRGIAITN